MLADKFPLSFWSKIDAYKPLYFPYSILENDLCSWVPESKRGRFDFTLACTYHDWLYRNAKRLEREFGFDTWNRNRRKSYDDSFLAMMSEWCDQYQKKKSCYALAFTYYQGVRLGGWK